MPSFCILYDRFLPGNMFPKLNKQNILLSGISILFSLINQSTTDLLLSVSLNLHYIRDHNHSSNDCDYGAERMILTKIQQLIMINSRIKISFVKFLIYFVKRKELSNTDAVCSR